MIAVLFHDVLAAGACFGLWILWRRWFGGSDKRVAWIVGAGLFLRAVVGQALFWISYLGLPLGRSLQAGNGIWFFALDGAAYMSYAEELLRRGPAALLLVNAACPARAYVQTLAAFIVAFGAVASVGLLLNCAAYLATCTLIVRLQPRVNGALLFALGALAFGPATLLWSLQPLKDTLFALLIAALFYACRRWQERQSLALAFAMMALAYLATSIRWYFGIITFCALLLFFVVTAVRMPRRVPALLANLALLLVLSQAVRLGGDGDISPNIARLLDPRSAFTAARQPTQVSQTIARARVGFENSPGATTIRPGPALEPPPPPTPAPAAVVAEVHPPVSKRKPAPVKIAETAPPPSTTTTATPPAPTTTIAVLEPAAPKLAEQPATTTATATVVAAQPTPSANEPAAAAPAPAIATETVAAGQQPEPKAVPPTATTAPAAVQPKPAAEKRQTRVAEKTETVAKRPSPGAARHPLPAARGEGTVVPAPPPVAIAAGPKPPVPRALSPVPLSFRERMISGVAITFLPRAIGQALGLVRVGGGRGLWAFAELDTVAFDAVLVFALVYCIRARGRTTPLFWLVLIVLVVTAGPLIYVVSNFGTLFRLRDMLYFLTAFLPVTLAPGSPR